MKNRLFTLLLAHLLGLFLVVGLSNTAGANYADRISREHRLGIEVDGKLEKGNALFMVSSLFVDGIRLSAVDISQFSMASAIYYFDIPNGTQSIEILVRYKGKPYPSEIEDYEEPIAGHLWIRNIRRDYSTGGRYGDTFVLRANRRSELIKIPTTGHVMNGKMELHIVAKGSEQLDIEYIEVSTYRRLPKIRVIQRYSYDYKWRPGYQYTYFHFYDGPIHYVTDFDVYCRWSYPIRDRRYLPNPNTRRYSRYKGSPPVYQRKTQKNRWSRDRQVTRPKYTRSRIANHNKPPIQRSTVSEKRRSKRIFERNNPNTFVEKQRRSTMRKKPYMRSRADEAVPSKSRIRQSSASRTRSTLSRSRSNDKRDRNKTEKSHNSADKAPSLIEVKDVY